MRKILPVVDCEVHVVHHIRSGRGFLSVITVLLISLISRSIF